MVPPDDSQRESRRSDTARSADIERRSSRTDAIRSAPGDDVEMAGRSRRYRRQELPSTQSVSGDDAGYSDGARPTMIEAQPFSLASLMADAFDFADAILPHICEVDKSRDGHAPSAALFARFARDILRARYRAARRRVEYNIARLHAQRITPPPRFSFYRRTRRSRRAVDFTPSAPAPRRRFVGWRCAVIEPAIAISTALIALFLRGCFQRPRLARPAGDAKFDVTFISLLGAV